MVVETKDAYHYITKPYIESIPREKIEWVYNILDRSVPHNYDDLLAEGIGL